MVGELVSTSGATAEVSAAGAVSVAELVACAPFASAGGTASICDATFEREDTALDD
ncbi:MAG: hypothetical protein AAFN74_05920 [Myxococcota bacterium]